MKNIKKILGMVMVLMLVVLTGCDNNKGPFETKQENGNIGMYSNGKPAKGGVARTVTNGSGNTVTVSEIYYDKGIPSGDFVLRNMEGYTIAEGKGKWKDIGVFEGTLYGKENNQAIESKGVYSINMNYLMDFNGQNNAFPILRCLYTGEYEETRNGIVLYKVTKDNNIATKETKFYGKDSIEYEVIRNNQNVETEKNEYYKNGKLARQTICDEEGYERELTKYFENGQMDLQRLTSPDGDKSVTNWSDDGTLTYYIKNNKDFTYYDSYNAIYSNKMKKIIPAEFTYHKDGKKFNVTFNSDNSKITYIEIIGFETFDEIFEVSPEPVNTIIKARLEELKKEKVNKK